MNHKLLLIGLLLLFVKYPPLYANNINTENATIGSINSAEGYAMLKFDISWDNSWRWDIPGTGYMAPHNYDAAWIFVKYRINGGVWQHATLNTSGSNHSAPAGSIIDGVADGKGVFMYRSENGEGSVAWQNTELRWEYAADGVAGNTGDNVEFKILAIEMVYVPEGSFYVGDFKESQASFFSGGTINPYQISSENAITVSNTAGNLYYTTGTYTGDGAGPIPAAFPKGFAAFYCMKYEITQGQYADFLNLLTPTQAENRCDPGLSYRYTILFTSSSYTASSPDRACNYISWADGTAYLDWSGLRPMSELEYEKACRGPLAPVGGEFAWGTNVIASDIYTLINNGTSYEDIGTNYSTTEGNSSYSITDGTIEGPLRAGIFASNLNNTGRVTSGATYYGIMEMTGNLWERVITVGNASGRTFTGTNGDGELTNDGNSNVVSWPNDTPAGSGFKGGNWLNSNIYCRVSDRTCAGVPIALNNRHNESGFRGVRNK